MEAFLLYLGAFAVKYGFWAIVVLLGLNIVTTFKRKQEEGETSIFDTVMQLKFRWLLFVFLFLFVSYMTSAETVYRPKNQIHTQNHTLQKQLEEIDSAEIVVPEAKYIQEIDFEEVKRKNREETEAAKAKFMELEKP